MSGFQWTANEDGELTILSDGVELLTIDTEEVDAFVEALGAARDKADVLIERRGQRDARDRESYYRYMKGF